MFPGMAEIGNTLKAKKEKNKQTTNTQPNKTQC
jgi:hypothetical protein